MSNKSSILNISNFGELVIELNSKCQTIARVTLACTSDIFAFEMVKNEMGDVLFGGSDGNDASIKARLRNATTSSNLVAIVVYAETNVFIQATNKPEIEKSEYVISWKDQKPVVHFYGSSIAEQSQNISNRW